MQRAEHIWAPNDLHNCGKIDHKHPFGWIDYPAPFLLKSVDPVSYTHLTLPTNREVAGISPASLVDEGTRAFYFFRSGWSMPLACIERRLLDCGSVVRGEIQRQSIQFVWSISCREPTKQTK